MPAATEHHHRPPPPANSGGSPAACQKNLPKLKIDGFSSFELGFRCSTPKKAAPHQIRLQPCPNEAAPLPKCHGWRAMAVMACQK
jgi:hypothetical protein